MREFDLVSIDWDTVRLLQAGQFKQENFYHEETVRWALQRARIYGILHMGDDSVGRPNPEGERMFAVSVHGIFAVGEEGCILEIPDNPDMAVQGMIEARYATVPLYVGVSITGRSQESEFYPTIDTGLLQCGGLRRQYTISSDNTDETMDWVQVAQFQRDSTGFLVPDPAYIPECMFLSAHAGQWQAQQSIQSLAQQALEVLEKHSTNSVQVYSAAAALAGSLGPASRVVDGRLHPRAYMDRLAGILAAQQTQLRALPNPNLAIYQETLDQIHRTLEYFDADWTVGQAFVMARECFERLLKLYPGLLKSLETAGPAPERRTLDHDTVVAAPRPGGAMTPYNQPPRGSNPPADDTPPPKRPGIWRR